MSDRSYFNNCISHLDCTVRGGTDDVVTIRSEGGLVHKRRVTAEFFKGFT